MSGNPEKDKNKTILSIDIGGTSIKACLLNEDGSLITDYTKLPTPEDSTPENVLKVVKQLVSTLGPFEKVSVGFPGYVKYGKVESAPNLAENKWTHIDLAQELADLFNKPVRLINDADQQGLGIASGKGFEIVVTVGTGFGTSLLFDGELLPHLELAHLPITKNKDYDEYIGNKAFEKTGKRIWNKRIKRIIEIYKTVFNFDTLYIGGGNSKYIDFDLDPNIKIFSNREGIKGGAKLWEVKEKYHVHTTYPKIKQ